MNNNSFIIMIIHKNKGISAFLINILKSKQSDFGERLPQAATGSTAEQTETQKCTSL